MVSHRNRRLALSNKIDTSGGDGENEKQDRRLRWRWQERETRSTIYIDTSDGDGENEKQDRRLQRQAVAMAMAMARDIQPHSTRNPLIKPIQPENNEKQRNKEGLAVMAIGGS